jgi:hypothetical protein
MPKQKERVTEKLLDQLIRRAARLSDDELHELGKRLFDEWHKRNVAFIDELAAKAKSELAAKVKAAAEDDDT